MRQSPLLSPADKDAASPLVQQSVEGVVKRVVFHNPQTGWTVLDIESEGCGELTAVGIMLVPTVGESAKLSGRWQHHPRYGQQFSFQQYELLRPTTADGIRRYLGGELIPGIGPKLAAALVEKFGEQTLTILDQAPQRLQEVDGIGPKRAAAAVEAWQQHRDVHRIMIFLQQHGIGAALANRIYSRYGPQAIELIEQQPYRLAREVRGIGFATADKIARSAGIPPDDPQRRHAALLHVLAQATDAGHFYLPAEELLQQTTALLQLPREQVEMSLDELIAEGEMVSERNEQGAAVYLPQMLAAEQEVAEMLLTLADKGPEAAPDGQQLQRWQQRRAALGDLPLTREQEDAIGVALRAGLSVITGGPGTGKTTIIRALADLCEALRRRVALASPTGRAAKRLEQVTGRPASTIHRLLSYDPRRDQFRYGLDEPLLVDTLIVDESSMLDTLLARDLLRALPSGAQLILVGDADQLPSVGPGDLLRDLLESEAVPVYELTTIHRQQADSLLVRNAHRINRGESPYFPTSKTWQREDCVLIEEDDAEVAAQRVLRIVTASLPKLGFSADDIQVITPLHRGPLGVDALNIALQQCLNPSAPTKAELTRGEAIFRVGDRVLQTVNNYDKSVYNGDIGRIGSIDRERKVFQVQFENEEVTYDFSELDQLELSYALTIHKSQGSEYPAVVIVMHSSHYVMLKRNLLYTALTRAERMACIVGNRRGIFKAINTAPERQRYTHLRERLRRLLPTASEDSGESRR